MICGSCRRRCDPNRSFCTHCGGSVFIDEREALSFFGQSAKSLPSTSDVSRQWRELQQSAKSVDRTAIADAARKLKARTRAAAQQAPAPIAFSFAPLIRFAVFVFVVWYAGRWLLTIPEVLVLKDRVQAGHFSDGDFQAARDAIGARIQTFLRNAQDPNPPSRQPQPAEATGRSSQTERPQRLPVERVPERPAPPSEPAAGRLLAPPETATLPPGVSLPGSGVTMPRVLHQVEPTYTTDAIRMRVEGTVVLQAVVRTHGVPADVSVVRSLDQRFGLDQQAIAAVRQWRFAPGERNGRPVPVLVHVEIPFSLK